MMSSQIATTVATTHGFHRSTPVPSSRARWFGPAISLRAVARKIVVDAQTVTGRLAAVRSAVDQQIHAGVSVQDSSGPAFVRIAWTSGSKCSSGWLRYEASNATWSYSAQNSSVCPK